MPKLCWTTNRADTFTVEYGAYSALVQLIDGLRVRSSVFHRAAGRDPAVPIGVGLHDSIAGAIAYAEATIEAAEAGLGARRAS